MSSSMQIGRAGQTAYTINMPEQLSLRGDMLTASGKVKGLSNADTLLFCRDQFQGVNNNIDEPVMPVVFSGDTTLTGFYTDFSLDVAYDPGGWDNGWVNWQLQARRLQSWSRPQVESTLMNAIRSNDLAITTAEYWWGPPPGIADGAGSFDGTQARTTDDGTYNILKLTTGSLSPQAGLATYMPDPTRWYESSASFSVAYNGTLRKVIGRNIKPITASTVGSWSISTGVVRLGPSSTTGTLLLEGNTGGTWRTLVAALNMEPAPNSSGIASVTISRNSPHTVSARIAFTTAGIGAYPGGASYVDVVARRGAPYFECTFAGNNGGFLFTGETGANITGGVQRSANDANGNRWFGLSSLGMTRAIGPPASVQTSTGGIAVGGLISGNSDTTTTVTDQYFATISESVNFVTR